MNTTENDFNAILELSFEILLNDSISLSFFEKEDVCSIFNISEMELNSILVKIEIKTIYERFKKGFDKCFSGSDISILGMYLICHYNENSSNELFRKYKPFFAQESIFFALKFLGQTSFNRRRKRKTSYSQEELEQIMSSAPARAILSELKQVNPEAEDTTHFFYHKKVVITGTFESFPVRNDMAKLLFDVGADINTAISKITDYVILGKDAGWRKKEQIEKYNIKTIEEEEFLQIMNIQNDEK